MKKTVDVVVIYSLSDPRTNEVRYVGKTFDPKIRLRGHLRDNYPCHRTHWVKSLKLAGLVPVLKVLETFMGVCDSTWERAERRWIKKMRDAGYRLTNLDSGGETGKRHSMETREKISRSHIGKIKSESHRVNIGLAHKGKPKAPFTDEHKANMSKAQKGRPKHFFNGTSIISPECREKARLANLGRVVSEEAKAKIREALIGRKKGPMSQSSRDKMSAIAKERYRRGGMRHLMQFRNTKSNGELKV